MPSFLTKIQPISSLQDTRKFLRRKNKKVVFTNGCFDLLHVGHVHYLHDASKLGDYLIVGINSDKSVQKIKGYARPINPQRHRAEVLSALGFIDAVTIFDGETPLELIRTLEPDILAKGADWPLEKIVGREEVESYGGQVVRIPIVPDVSTSLIIEKIRGGK